MYVYIYDEFTNQAKYKKLLYKIERRLTDLNLNGETIRLGALKDLKTAIEDKIKRGAKTIVAVGDGQTVNRIMNIIVDKSREKKYLTLGIISLDEKINFVANSLGIKNIEDACDILLARRVETFKLAQINQGYFLFKVNINSPNTVLEIDRDYAIKNTDMANIEILSTLNLKDLPDTEKRKLKLTIRNKDGQSAFPFNELLVVNRDIPIIIDDSFKIDGPARIKPSQEEIKIIVGKERQI